jgi:dihydrofolate reductase
LGASEVRDKYESFCKVAGRSVENVHSAENVAEAVLMARNIAALMKENNPEACPMIYVGGSTYVVSEAIAVI